MLKLLHIENIAVIEHCDIEFERGFNVLTGETGAGKSIIIDSIGAVLGYRTTKDIVRNGESKASVTAVFNNCGKEAQDWLSENGYDSDDEIIISREISVDGKSSARINGKPITASMLKLFGVLLINVLGQHDSQQLLDPEVHPVFIDRFAASEEYNSLRDSYAEIYNELLAKIAERKKLDMDETAKARQVEMLKFQIEELEAAELKENEDVQLLEKQRVIRDSVKVLEKLSCANSAFFGEGDFVGICSALADASKALNNISDISKEINDVSEVVSELCYTAEDVAEKLRRMVDSLDFSEGEIDAVESRLDVIHKLKRKYGNSVEEMLSYLEKAKNELSEIEFSEERILALDTEIDKLDAEARSIAHKIYEIRVNTSKVFEERIMRELSELDMKNAKFFVKIDLNQELSPRGLDSIRFYIATNLGETEKPLEKIASGGELSRIMLAMKNALDETDFVETLIFDEIDTGVSGRAAQRIAEKLYRLSIKKQVLCVTHLAQISAMSDVHFKIEKKEQAGRTYTSVSPLDSKGRAQELARITGGSEISDITLKNAEEMILLAEKSKSEIRKI